MSSKGGAGEGGNGGIGEECLSHFRSQGYYVNEILIQYDIVRFRPQPHPHGFVSGNSHENFPVGHPSWECSRPNSLNFGVLTESEASELPKGLILGPRIQTSYKYSRDLNAIM
ncbi:hypothetical protein DVH24_013244 [Malus domestica]|uniref:Uncharacterized protein n=1 Tax=Malus domestica TaxID=3750 RepID=A0A498HGA6_MALDO|nr:hypothetical protein DVH24_013244 [Malus domestica]